jgi:EmrB/QacA subfamily drug resistance transporter
MAEVQPTQRTAALAVLCLGVLMIVLDTTIVTVALPSVLADFKVSAAALTWLMNAYMLTFSGFLLLGGRLGDLYGPRRLFMGGISLFSLASLACGLAHTQTTLIIARAVQGMGSAVVAAVSLSLILNLFPEPSGRARAMGIYGFVCAAGGGLGDLLGGLLTKTLGWHWVFLVNVPIGAAVCALCLTLLPRDAPLNTRQQLDVAGAIAITMASTLFVYALVNITTAGWSSTQTIGTFGAATLLLALFVILETHASEPLMPPRLFRLRSFSVANLIGALWSAGTFAWYAIAALYLQRVLGYDPATVGLSFAPGTVLLGLFSAGLSAKVALRFGNRAPLSLGLALIAAGLTIFSRAPTNAIFLSDVLPGMLLLGLGAGIASTPLLLLAMQGVDNSESGLASGIINTAMIMGAAVGLAVFATLADDRTHSLLAQGVPIPAALNSGYHAAFRVAALITATAATISAVTPISNPDPHSALQPRAQ